MTCVSAVSLLPFMGINLPARDNFVTSPVRRQKISPVPSFKRKPFSFENNLDAIQGGGTHGVQPLSCLTPKPKSREDYLPRIQAMNRKWINQSPNINEKKTREVVAKKIEDCFLHNKEELDLSYQNLNLSCGNSSEPLLETNFPVGILRSGSLTTLSPTIGTLFHLKNLSLSGHILKKIPKTVKYLNKLEELDLDNNLFNIFPENILQLKNLKRLNMQTNGLRALPENIDNLHNLEQFSLDLNNLKELPDSMSKMSNLRDLSMSFNKFVLFPSVITKLQNLDSLSMSSNKLNTLPDTITNLLKLKSLGLSNNKLEALPYNIGDLPSLKYFDLSNNNLERLPHNISDLSCLKSFNLSNNKLTFLSNSFCKLSNLKNLALNRNRIKMLPENLGVLSQLENIGLEGNILSNLPESFNDLLNLRGLDLRSNKFKKGSFIDLPQLKTFFTNLHKNKSENEIKEIIKYSLSFSPHLHKGILYKNDYKNGFFPFNNFNNKDTLASFFSKTKGEKRRYKL